jgi:AhpD family alkylhydroperoxidase
MDKDYASEQRHLSGLVRRLSGDIPSTMRSLSELQHAALSEGALSTKTKELMSLAIAIAMRCDGCIAPHVHDAMEAGAKRQEITETIGVAVLMGGDSALTYGAEALEAVHQFEEERSGHAIRTGA